VSVSLESRYRSFHHNINISNGHRHTSRDMCGALSEKLPILAAPLRFVAFYAVNPRENSFFFLRNYSSLATFLSLAVNAHVHSVTHGLSSESHNIHVHTSGMSSATRISR